MIKDGTTPKKIFVQEGSTKQEYGVNQDNIPGMVGYYREDVFDGYRDIRSVLALAFMHYLDEIRQDNKMCLSNMECEDIDKAFLEMDFQKIKRYIAKYSPEFQLNEDIANYMSDHFTVKYDETIVTNDGDYLKTSDFYKIAKHFYRLGTCDGYGEGRVAGEKCMKDLMSSPKECNCGSIQQNI